jgi:hypothetical protein
MIKFCFSFLFALAINSAISLSAFAGTVTEDFSTSTNFDATNSTAVWNSALKMVHTPIAIDPTTGVGVNENSPVIDVGDGSDGPFNITTYANFSEGGSTAGNVITINTDLKPALNFTDFNLASGWTIKGKGSKALWIKVQGNFVNTGTIHKHKYGYSTQRWNR